MLLVYLGYKEGILYGRLEIYPAVLRLLEIYISRKNIREKNCLWIANGSIKDV